MATSTSVSEVGMSKTGMTKKEDVLREFVESSRKVVFGFSKEGLEESRELITRMVEFGRITEDQAKLLKNQLTEQTQRCDQMFEAQVTDIINSMTPRLEAIANRELSELERRIARLEGVSTPAQTQTANI